MAFFGSPATQLSPLFSKGDLFSEGVNILIHNDISKSMNVYPYGSVTFNTISDFDIGSGTGGVELNSMFYDGIIIEQLQTSLLSFGVGADTTSSPNIFAYFDVDLRQSTGTFTISRGSEEATYDRYFLRGGTGSSLKSTWDSYIKSKPGFFNTNINLSGDPLNPTNYAFKSIRPGVTNFNSLVNSDVTLRLTGVNLQNYQLTEDVHGVLMSLFYLDNNTTLPVTERIEAGLPGVFARNILADKFRKRNKNFVITASNEQENSGPDMIGVGVSVRDNVGTLEYDRTEYLEPGLYAKRYWHYFLDNGVSDYGGREFAVTLTSIPDSATRFYSAVSDATNLRERIRLRYNQLVSNTDLRTGQSTVVSLTNLNPLIPNQSYFTLLQERYNVDRQSNQSYTNPSSSQYVPFIIGNNQTEEFGRYFDLIAVPWPTGNATRSNCSTTIKSIPSSLNPANPSELSSYITTQGNGNWSSRLVNSPGIVSKTSTTLLNSSGQDVSEGVISDIDRLRSDIGNYSIMIFGYFVPRETGVYTFRLNSNEVSLLWFGEPAVARDTDGISIWSGDSASARSKSKTDSEETKNIFGASTTTGQSAGDAGSSTTIALTKGKIYPIRMLMGNRGDWVVPAGTGNGWGGTSGALSGGRQYRDGTSTDASYNNYLNSDGTVNTGATNSSFFTFSFAPPKADGTAATTEAEFRTDGTGYFYGGKRVSELGSEFNPVRSSKKIVTLIEEMNRRNISVIALSNYESPSTSLTKDYDGVFFPPGNNVYRYVKFLTPDTMKIDNLSTPPDWIPSSYFKNLPYFITQSEITGNTGIGTGAQFIVERNNTRYETRIIQGGFGFKKGDRFTIARANIGNTGSNLVLEVTSVATISVTVTGTNFVAGANLGSGAKFTVSKTAGSNGTSLGYFVNKVSSGSNYQVGDRISISGETLDGSSANELKMQVLTVSSPDALGQGPINTFQIGYDGEPTPVPSDRIVYGKTAGLDATYNPRPITGGIKYETFNINNIGYEHYDVSGIAYTTISNSQISGIAYTASSISNVGYTTLPIVSIAYNAPTITSIGYSSPDVVSIGYTFGTISNISYPRISNIVSIGYTTPSILSIGHTSFNISSIEWTTSRSLDSATEIGGSGGNTLFTLASSETGLGKTLGLAQGDRVIFYNVKDPDETYSLSELYDNQIFTVTNVLSNTQFEINKFTSGGPETTQNFNYPSGPLTKYLCISKPETDPINSSGLSSSVQITTSSNHSFQIGNEIIIYGSNALLFNGTRFVVDSTPSPTTFTLAGTGTTELFTSGITTLTQSGVTKSGYYSSTLEVQFKTQASTVAISSISYDLSDPNKTNQSTPSRYYFEEVRNNGSVGVDRRIGLRNVTSTNSGDGYNSANSPFKTSDQIYVFGVSNNGGPGGIDFNSTNLVGDIVGYAFTVQSVSQREVEIYVRDVANFANIFNPTSPIYAIKRNSVPFVRTSTSHGVKVGDIINISGNQNDRYNNSFKVASVGSGVTFTLGNFVTGSELTTEQLLTASGNQNSSNGNISYNRLADTEVRVNSGDIVDIFGNSNSSYNLNNATLVSTGNTNTFKFGLNTPTIPSTLTDGLGGNIGLSNIVGIITTSSAHNFGSAGSIIPVRIYNTSTGFDKNYNNSIILDSTRIQLGQDSLDPQSFYDPDSTAYRPPETGKVFLLNSPPRITLTSGQNFQTLGFANNTTVDLQNTVSFNSTNSAIIDNISGNTADLRNISNPTNPDVVSTSGQIGLRNSPANVTISFSKTLQELRIGNIGDTATIDIQNATGFNGDNQSIRIYGPYTFGLVNRTNPTSYSTVVNTGRIGFKNMPGIGTITGNLQTLGFGNPGSETSVRIQKTNTSFDNSDAQQTIRIYSATEFGTLFTLDPNDHTESYSGTKGILGLQNSAPIVTISGNLQTSGFGNISNTFNSKIQNTGIGTFEISDVSTILSSTQFSLPGAINPTDYSSSYSNVGNPLQAVVGLRGSSLVVTTTSNHEFIPTNSVQLQNTNNFDGTYTVSSVLSSTRIALNQTMTTGTNLVSSSNGVVGLRDFPATVRLNVAIPNGIVNGSSIKLENTGITNFNGNKTVSNIDFGRRLFTLSGVTNPTNFADSSSSNTNRIIGLNAAPTVTTSSTHALTDSNNITIYGVTDNNSVGFNQQFTSIRIYSTTQFGLISPDLSSPSSFVNINAGTGGVIGVNNRNAIVNTTDPHPFTNNSNIRIVGNTISDSGITAGIGTVLGVSPNYNGTYRITVETPTRFRLNSTSLNNQPNASTSYDDVGTGGYFVGVSSEPLVTLTNHNFPNGSSIQISGTSQPYFNGNFVVKLVDSNNFYLQNQTSPPSNNYTITSASNVGLATLTSGAGSGAKFRVNRTWIADGRANYSGITTAYVDNNGSVTWFTPGSSYRVGDVLRISGNLLGGKVPTHDAIFRVSEVSQTNSLLPNYRPGAAGQILTIGDVTPGTGLAQGETADPAMDYSDSNESLIQFDATSVAGNGSNASFNVTREGDTNYKITLNNGGTGYAQNDEIDIFGTQVGGTNPTNNIRITVTQVSSTTGAIVGTGFTYTGTSVQSNPVSGITTVSGAPEGIESSGRNLNQTQNTLTLADSTDGGLFKISNVYSLGSFSNYKNPEIIYWPSVTTFGYGDSTNRGSLFFDTRGGTGIATILMSNTPVDDSFLVDFKLGDEIMVFGTGSQFVDYDKVGYALTIVGINSSTKLPYGPNNTTGTTAGNDNYAANADDRYQFISFQTSMRDTGDNNYQQNIVSGVLLSGSGSPYDRLRDQFGVSILDNILRTDVNSGNTLALNKQGFNGAIINANIDARVYSTAHGFTTSVTIDASSVNSGLAKSTYQIVTDPYLLSNLYTDIRQSPTAPIDNADIIGKLNVGSANHFRIIGFTPKKYLDTQIYDLTQTPVSGGSSPPQGPRRFIITGGTTNDVPYTLWNPDIGNGDIADDGTLPSVDCRLAKAIIAYDPFDRSKPGAYVGISTVDNRVAFAKAVAQYISGN